MKGIAKVKFEFQGQIYIEWAEIHWYEAHGMGKKDFKIKSIFWS